MATRLFVGNVAGEVSDQELGAFFKEYGTVRKAEVVRGRGGKGRGFGYVELASDSEVVGAIAALNGKELYGRVLTLAEARSHARSKPLEEESFTRPSRGQYSGGRGRSYRS